MELLIGAAIAGVVFALAVFVVLYRVIGRAVDNLLRWLITTFGNESSRRRLDDDGQGPPGS